MLEELLLRRAPLASVGSSTFNAETRSMRAVIAAGAEVLRWDERGEYLEALDPAGIIMPGDGSAPLLNNHQRGDLGNVIGSATEIAAAGSRIEATLVLSSRADVEPIAADIAAGHLRAISIGYRVEKQREEKAPNGRRRMVATRWSLVEVSIVPVAADPKAKIRGEHMDPELDNPPANPTPPAPVIATRAQMNADIRTLATSLGLGAAWSDARIDAGETIEQARTLALDAVITRGATPAIQTARSSVGLDNNDPEIRARAMGEAIAVRAGVIREPSERAREFVGFTTLDMARDALRVRGISTTGLSPASVIERALLSTSDFPAAFGDSVGRVLAQSYQAAPSGIRQLARQSTVRDFRAKSQVSIANSITLEKVNEAGEFKSGSLVEAAESYKADTYGKIIGITRQILVNDDLGAFIDLAGRLGQAAAAFEADFLLARITANPALSDGVAVFHASHGNLAAAAAAIDTGPLGLARLALRKQTDAGGGLISVTPKFLLVGPEIETDAEKILATITPAETAKVNPFSGKLTLVVEPRLSGKSWFVVADPAEVPSLEYSYLEGEPGPQVTQEIGFDVDGLRFRVRLDYGAGWLDHRGWFKNAGA